MSTLGMTVAQIVTNKLSLFLAFSLFSLLSFFLLSQFEQKIESVMVLVFSLFRVGIKRQCNPQVNINWTDMINANAAMLWRMVLRQHVQILPTSAIF
jgi:hypothetical protein